MVVTLAEIARVSGKENRAAQKVVLLQKELKKKQKQFRKFGGESIRQRLLVIQQEIRDLK